MWLPKSLRQTAYAFGIIFCQLSLLQFFRNKYLLSNETPNPNIFSPEKACFYDVVSVMYVYLHGC